MIYFDRIKEYQPFGRQGNSIFFGFVTESKLFGQAIANKKSAYVCKIVCLKPDSISYRRSFMKLCPSKFIPALAELGFPKAEYVFALEQVESLPAMDILNPELHSDISLATLTQPPAKKK